MYVKEVNSPRKGRRARTSWLRGDSMEHLLSSSEIEYGDAPNQTLLLLNTSKNRNIM